MKSPSRAVLGLGAGLAAAGVGAALGLAAERWTVGRGSAPHTAEAYGSLRGVPQRVPADDGTTLYAEVDELEFDGGPTRGPARGPTRGPARGRRTSRAPDEPPTTIVFSHGFCLTHDIWHYQRQWLRGRYRLVFWDQRGHGRSHAGPPENYTLDQCGADLRSVIDATAPAGPVVLVGHSMGGMTVMALAAQQPQLVHERVVGVGFIATSAGGLAQVHWGMAGSLGRAAHRLTPTALAGLTHAPRLVQRSRKAVSGIEQLLVRRYSYSSPVSPELVRFTSALIAATPLDVVAAFLPGFDLHDRAEALAALSGIEALVLSGEQDLLTPLDHSEAIVRRLPGAEHVVVPQAGHLVMLEHPDVVNLHLGELMDRVDRAVRCSRAR